jgi:hypothetical protein
MLQVRDHLVNLHTTHQQDANLSKILRNSSAKRTQHLPLP